jgi:hypothetical protein
MAAVLVKALDDQGRRANPRALFAWERRDIEDAIAWIASTDRRWPFSFENICEALGMEADELRRRLRREMPS